MAEQALPSVERMERMLRVIAESPDSLELGEQDGILVGELRALLSAARLVPVLMAEVEAWRKAEHLRKDEPHAEFMKLAEARAATDRIAALAKMEGR